MHVNSLQRPWKTVVRRTVRQGTGRLPSRTTAPRSSAGGLHEGKEIAQADAHTHTTGAAAAARAFPSERGHRRGREKEEETAAAWALANGAPNRFSRRARKERDEHRNVPHSHGRKQKRDGMIGIARQRGAGKAVWRSPRRTGSPSVSMQRLWVGVLRFRKESNGPNIHVWRAAEDWPRATRAQISIYIYEENRLT